MPQLQTNYKECLITAWTDRQGLWRWVVQSPFDPHTVLGRSGPLKDPKSAEETIAHAQRWIDTCNSTTVIYKGLEINASETTAGWYWDVWQLDPVSRATDGSDTGVLKANNSKGCGAPSMTAAIAYAKQWIEAYMGATRRRYKGMFVHTWEGNRGWQWEVWNESNYLSCSQHKREGVSEQAAIAEAMRWIDVHQMKKMAEQMNDIRDEQRDDWHDYDSQEIVEETLMSYPRLEPEPIDVPKVSRQWLEDELQRQKHELAATVKQIESLQAMVTAMEANIEALRQTLVCHATRHTEVKPTA